jgi:hypothetical protein
MVILGKLNASRSNVAHVDVAEGSERLCAYEVSRNLRFSRS